MEIHEIENLSFAELKQRRDDLIESLKSQPPGVLAARYLQARTDAKQRDEKLSEQGTTINNLNELVQTQSKTILAREEQLSSKDKAISKYVSELEAARKAHSDEVSVLNGQLKECRESLAAETARADRLKSEADRANKALTSAEKSLKDALAERELEATDKGE